MKEMIEIPPSKALRHYRGLPSHLFLSPNRAYLSLCLQESSKFLASLGTSDTLSRYMKKIHKNKFS